MYICNLLLWDTSWLQEFLSANVLELMDVLDVTYPQFQGVLQSVSSACVPTSTSVRNYKVVYATVYKKLVVDTYFKMMMKNNMQA